MSMTPLAWRNIVHNDTLDPTIILNPMSVANSVNSFTRTFDSTFNIANNVAGHEDLCNGFFPVEPIIVSESMVSGRWMMIAKSLKQMSSMVSIGAIGAKGFDGPEGSPSSSE
jgi:hypothetical protein